MSKARVTGKIGRIAGILTWILMVSCAPAYEPGRAYLTADSVEPPDYGLYSYILFAAPPTDATHARYESTVRAYLNIPTIASLERDLQKQQINATFIPVDSTPSADNVESILNRYDYARARVILRILPGSNTTGPYLVSSTLPVLASDTLPREVFWQDLGSVPPQLIGLWVEEFFYESASPEGYRGDWKESWTLRVRTAIAQAAEGWPKVKGALDEYMSWVRTVTE